MLFISSWINIHLFVHFSFFFRRRSSRLFDPGDNWFPAFSPPGCVPDGCVYTRSAAYEFRIMMDGRAKSKEHETAFAATPHVSIHLLLMQQPQRRGSGTLRWRPSEPWVIYHVSSQSSSPDMHNSILTFFICFYLLFFISTHIAFHFSIISFPFFLLCLFPFLPFHFFFVSRLLRHFSICLPVCSWVLINHVPSAVPILNLHICSNTSTGVHNQERGHLWGNINELLCRDSNVSIKCLVLTL